MSILGGIGSNSSSMNGPSFNELKKQASFFLKEKIKTARLALTDVTPAQILAEEATNGNPGGPDARTLKMISKAAFEVDDYWRIVEILHKRFVRFERRNWRASYKALMLLEHLLTHGPERVAEEFQGDRDVIKEMENFHHIDDKGFDWGVNVRKKSERILKLLGKGPLLKEERDKARKISRGIQGFGSFCIRASSDQETQSSLKSFDRCNSDFTHHTNQEDLFPIYQDVTTKTQTEKKPITPTKTKTENSSPLVDSKENLAPTKRILEKELIEKSRNCTGEKKPLLGERRDDSRIKTSMEDHHHPFEDSKNLSAMSLLSAADELQAY